MSDLHIDDFCRDTAKVLTLLYKQFPQKIILYVEDICGPDSPDEFGLHAPRFVAAFNTVLWLQESDYLNFSDTVRQEAFQDVTLSHRAFTFLSSLDEQATNLLHSSGAAITDTDNSDPANTQIQPLLPPTLPTRINVIRDTLANRSSEALKQLVMQYLQDSRNYR